MLKSELISLLSLLPGNPTMMVEGYEGGLCDIFPSSIQLAPIVIKDININESWNGPHEEMEADEVRERLLWDDTSYESCSAYIIRRKNKE